MLTGVGTPVATAPPAQTRRRTEKSKKRKSRTRLTPGQPVQDEWGIFDPNQCGFSALVDKLDEVTDSPRTERTSVRVISFS
jgi:hypothetical protein